MTLQGEPVWMVATFSYYLLKSASLDDRRNACAFLLLHQYG